MTSVALRDLGMGIFCKKSAIIDTRRSERFSFKLGTLIFSLCLKEIKHVTLIFFIKAMYFHLDTTPNLFT